VFDRVSIYYDMEKDIWN